MSKYPLSVPRHTRCCRALPQIARNTPRRRCRLGLFALFFSHVRPDDFPSPRLRKPKMADLSRPVMAPYSHICHLLQLACLGVGGLRRSVSQCEPVSVAALEVWLGHSTAGEAECGQRVFEVYPCAHMRIEGLFPAAAARCI